MNDFELPTEDTPVTVPAPQVPRRPRAPRTPAASHRRASGAFFNETPEIRLRAGLRALGTPEQVAGMIADYGYNAPTPSTVSAWMTRNSLPVGWCVILLDLLLRNKIITRPAEFLAQPTNWGSQQP